MTNQKVLEEPSSKGKQAYPQSRVLQELPQPNSIHYFCQGFVRVKIILYPVHINLFHRKSC